MTYSPEFLDEIRLRAPLVEIIGKRVDLTKKGAEHVALCPFHKEKTPSFTVNEDKGFYHCFGCGVHGDVIDFVMRFANRSFHEAVEDLHGGHGFTNPNVTRRAAERQHHAEAERHAQDKREVQSRIEYARHLWRNAVPAPGTLVEAFTKQRRKVTLEPPPKGCSDWNEALQRRAA